MEKIFLSVIIPSFDEIVNLRKGVLDKVKSFLSKKKYSYEVIIVDDGSKDGSIEFIKKFAKENPHFHLIENPHMGKAGAVTTGMLNATGTYRIFADMDQATPIEEIDNLLPYLTDKKYDIAIGSREKNTTYPISRLIIHHGMIVLRKLIVGIYNISDTQCGFKMFTAPAAEKLFTKISRLHHGFSKISGSAVKAGFDVELLYLAQKMGYKIKEVPVEWLYVETRRVNPFKDSVDGLLHLFKIRIDVIQGKYKNV